MHILLVLAVVVLFIIWWYIRPGGFPVGPRGIPLLGVIPMISSKPHETFHQWATKFGKVFSARVGCEDWVILNDITAMKEALVKNGDKFNGRPSNYFSDQLLSRGRRGIIFTDGPAWKKQRKFGVTALQKLISIGRINFEDIIREEATALLKNLSSQEDKPQDCKETLVNAFVNVIHALIHGYRLEHGSREFTELTDFMKLFILDPEKTWKVHAIVFCPTLRFFPPFRKEVAEIVKNREIAENYLRAQITKHISNQNNNNATEGFIDAFVTKSKEDSHFDETQLMYYMRDLLIGGTETTTSSLLWCILAAARNIESQKMIQAEIDEVFGPAEPTVELEKHMPYTQAFIHEVQRYCTTAPLGMPHQSTANAQLQDYFIPKGTKVIVNLWSIHRDENIFNNPHEFNPERFLNSKGEFVNSHNVVPFSLGARTCIGKKLAKMEIFIFFTSILQRYSLKVPDHSNLPSLDDGLLATAYSPKTFKLLFERRL